MVGTGVEGVKTGGEKRISLSGVAVKEKSKQHVSWGKAAGKIERAVSGNTKTREQTEKSCPEGTGKFILREQENLSRGNRKIYPQMLQADENFIKKRRKPPHGGKVG